MKARHGTAVLLIDVVNAFDFPRSAPLVKSATRAAPRIEALCKRARASGVPVVYVNDNFGQWRSDFRSLVRRVASRGGAPAVITERLRPDDDDYFVLKPQHSGFYSTPLDLLVAALGIP